MSTERELFEAWSISVGLCRAGRFDESAWVVWQAARSADTSGARWADTKRLDWLQSFADQAHARGFVWDTFTFLVKDGAPTIRAQIDAQIASGWVKSARNPGLPEPPPAAPGGPAGARRPDDQERDDA